MCGDTDNGFGLLFNWNRLGDGRHTVRALADREEFAHSTFTVTTLGEAFAENLARTHAIEDFPAEGPDDDGRMAAGAAELCHYRGGVTPPPPAAPTPAPDVCCPCPTWELRGVGKKQEW